VIVLLDKMLSEHVMTVRPAAEIAADLKAIPNSQIFPGTPNQVVKITSYEHDEAGFTIDKAEDVQIAMDKRFAKGEEIKKEMQNSESVKIFGDESSENVIVFFGSTKSAVLEASKHFGKPAKLVQIVWLEPFDSEKVLNELKGKNVICVEGNHDGQLASLIREKTGIEIKNKILKYDSMPFDPDELANQINKIWN
jgi:2-oxoglutarate ferredoxin oxidoreductase subunit alpha